MTKQNSFTKKVFSLLLSLAMVLTMMPAAAFAEDVAVQAAGDAVAEVTIGDATKQYIDIKAAFEAAQNATGATVKLLSNVTTTSLITVSGGTVTLDLNGKKWDRSGGYTLKVSDGNVTVTSSNGTGTISNTGGGSAIYVENNATVHVTSGVRLSRLYAMDAAKLTLDVDVIITDTFYAKAENIAPFLTGKALQACDENYKPIDGEYVSIYEKYDTNAKETGCVIVIEHKSCDGTPSKATPCEICGYDGTQTKPTEPADSSVAEVNGAKYETLTAAIQAANGADITLLKIFGENVVVSDENSKASIILGNGGTVEGEATYPSNWMADSSGIPLTMNAGEITLKSGVLSQGKSGADNNIAIKLKGGTLTVADTVTKIIGGSADSTAQNTAQMAAIEAIGGTLDLQGNTHLDGGLSISGDAQLTNKLTAGIFTNSGSSTASVSVEASNHYGTVFDLLETGYAFAKYNADGTTGDVITKNDSTKSLMEDVIVIKCAHKDANGTSLFENGVCKGCGYECSHTVDTETGKCTTCQAQMAAKIGDSYFTTLAAAIKAATNNGTVTLLADVEENITITDGMNVIIDLNGKTWGGYGTGWQAAVPLTVGGGSVTVQKGTLNQGGSSSFANSAVKLEGGSLTVGEDMTIQGTVYASDECRPAIDVQGGSLTLSVGTKLIYGMSVPEGKTLADYLPTNTAFQQAEHQYSDYGDYFDSESAKIINGYVQKKTGDFMLTVVEHSHTGIYWDTTSYKLLCACGKMVAQDTVMPQFEGIKYGTTYYGDVKFKVTHKYDFTVTDNGTTITPDADGYYTVKADNKGHEIRATAVSGMNNFENIKVYKVYNVTLPTGEGYTITGDATVGYKQEYTFTVKIANGYSATDSYGVKVNNEAIIGTQNDNTYTYTIDGDKVSANLNITVEGIKDITAPEAEIKIGENSFKSFLNTVTFKLFFKNTQTVTVTAADAGSGVAKAEYLLSKTPLTEASVKTGAWTELNLTDGKGSFSIQPNDKGYVYVRVTDNSGNATVVNSEGVVVYTDSEALTSSIKFTRLSADNVYITVDLKGNTVKSISCDGVEINSEQYDVLYPSSTDSSTLGTIELKETFLSTLAAGEHTIKVEYNPMGEAYVERTGNVAPTANTVKLTVVKAERTLTYSAPNADYDGEAYDNLDITGRPEGTTVKYKKQDAADDTYSTDAPKNAGSYTVQITTPEDEDYNAKTVTADFTIAKKKVTITSVTAGSKTYDGSNSATITNSGKLSENYDGENLTIVKGKATFDNANAGTGKNVTFTEFALDGSAAGNYELKAQPEPVKADINKADATYTAPTKKTDLVYNGNAQELITAGRTADGTMKYSLDNSNWQDAVPTGTEAKTYTVWYKVIGDGNHSDTTPVPLDVTIQAKTVTATVTVKEDSFIYNGEAHTTEVTVKDGDTVIDSSEYSVSYSDNTNAGEATVTVTDKEGGNYTVNGSTTFTIKPFDIKDAVITLDGSLTYTGKEQTQKISSVKVGDLDVTYDVSGNTGTNAGDYPLTVTGTGNFTGTATIGFTIAQATVTTTDKPTQNSIYAGTDVSKATFKPNETSKKNEVTVNFNGKTEVLEGTWSITEAKDSEGKEITKFEKAGKYTCTATFTPEDPNFAPIIIDGIEITVTNKPSGGGAVIPASEVTTDKTGTADEKVTTSPAEVKTETKTGADGSTETISKVTVSDANQKEIIKQVKDNKSGEIILDVSEKDTADNAKLEISLDKDFIDSIIKDTDASLTIKTPQGDKTFTQEELKKLFETAEGGVITIDSSVFAEPTEPDKAEKIAKAKSLIGELNLVACSSKTAKKNVKVVLKKDTTCADAMEELKELGFTVKYRFYRSTKKSAGYKSTVTQKTASYLNTSGKKGMKYFYKVQIRVYDENDKLIAKTALKQCKYASRTWTKESKAMKS